MAVERTEVIAPQPVATGFEDYYRANRDHLTRALVLSLGSLELGRDAAAEAMTRTFQHWRKVRRYANPMGWSYRVGLNWGRSRRRKQAREVAMAGSGPIVFDHPQLDRRLDDALGALPIGQRAVVVLRYYLDWSVADIAAALGLPAGTVKSRLHRALAALQHEMGDHR